MQDQFQVTSVPTAISNTPGVFIDDDPGWRWPLYRRLIDGGGLISAGAGAKLLQPLVSASFIEWRYYAILAPAFHGVVGLALFNPEERLRALSESGLLVIVAGLLGQPHGDEGPAGRMAIARPDPDALCWMHLFPTAACQFDQPAIGGIIAQDADCRLTLRQPDAALAELRLDLHQGLRLHLTHQGLHGTAIAPVVGNDLACLPGGHWILHCPSPVAESSGELRLGPSLGEALAKAVRGGGCAHASPSLLSQLEPRTAVYRWQRASGYAEHSFGFQPLPLHGWDFLFAPDAARGQALVMQTYRGSRQLRYVEVCWRQDGEPRHHRFDADAFRLTWPEQYFDPMLGVRRPLRRLITAESHGLRLTVDNQVLQRIPLLRPRRFAARHFFISEEMGLVDWSLSTADERLLAQANAQPCGGELAHFRLRAPAGDRHGP